MTTAAAIVNWNSGHWLRACIEALLTTSADLEIIVVDNASSDDSLDRAQGFRNHADFIRNSVNRGFAGAVNQAFGATTATSVLVLNPDVRSTPGAVRILEEYLDRHPRVGAVGGYVNDKYLPRALPTWQALVRQNLGLRSRHPVDGSGAPGEVEQLAGAALMIRREAFEEVGGFDEQFQPAWYEDVDFCKRLRDVGWQLHFVPSARFLHEGGYSARPLGQSAFVSAYYRNQLRYSRKHLGSVASVVVRASIAAGMLARMTASPSRARDYWPALQGSVAKW